MSSCRLGLIGAGRWGKTYINALSRLDNVVLGSLCSGNPSTRSLVGSDCKISGDWKYVLDDTSLDGVIICSPPAFHYEIARSAINKGLHVLVEKPMTLCTVDARNLVYMASQRGLALRVGHIHLFSASFSRLLELVANRGDPIAFTSIAGNHGPIRTDVNVLWDWSPHDIAMILRLTRQVPTSVYVEVLETQQDLGSNAQTIKLLLEFSAGSVAAVTLSNIFRQKQRLFEVLFEGEKVVYDDQASFESKLAIFSSHSGLPTYVDVGKSSDSLESMILEFAKSAITGCHYSANTFEIDVIETIARCERSIVSRSRE